MTTPDHSGTHATLADSGDNANSQALPRGSSLGRYVIIEPIGSGGMGTVYRAYDPQLNRGVALKILSVKQEDFQAAERAKARLIREAQALAQLSHPNVVAVHDAGTYEDDVYIAMELVEGKNLRKITRHDKASWERANRATAQLEQCRLGLIKVVNNAVQSMLVDNREKWANTLRSEMLGSGIDVKVALEGEYKDRVIMTSHTTPSLPSSPWLGTGGLGSSRPVWME